VGSPDKGSPAERGELLGGLRGENVREGGLESGQKNAIKAPREMVREGRRGLQSAVVSIGQFSPRWVEK